MWAPRKARASFRTSPTTTNTSSFCWTSTVSSRTDTLTSNNAPKSREADLFAGLQELSEDAFPKACSYCGRRFATAEEFVKATTELPGGRCFKANKDENDRPILELYRNCVCGSTLMDAFNDRRDTSSRGLRRRDRFGRLVAMLEERGLSTAEARDSLLQLLRGEDSPRLRALGIKLGQH